MDATRDTVDTPSADFEEHEKSYRQFLKVMRSAAFLILFILILMAWFLT